MQTLTPAINEGCTRSLRISHTSRRASLPTVSKTQVPCTPYRPPNRTGVRGACRPTLASGATSPSRSCTCWKPCGRKAWARVRATFSGVASCSPTPRRSPAPPSRSVLSTVSYLHCVGSTPYILARRYDPTGTYMELPTDGSSMPAIAGSPQRQRCARPPHLHQRGHQRTPWRERPDHGQPTTISYLM
jgi:hypothetical protein